MEFKIFFWIILRFLQFFLFLFPIFRPCKYKDVREGGRWSHYVTPSVAKQYKANSNKEDNKVRTKYAPDTVIVMAVSVPRWHHSVSARKSLMQRLHYWRSISLNCFNNSSNCSYSSFLNTIANNRVILEKDHNFLLLSNFTYSLGTGGELIS